MKAALARVLAELKSPQARPSEIALARIIVGALGAQLGVKYGIDLAHLL